MAALNHAISLENIKSAIFSLLREKENFFPVRANQNSMRVSEVTLFHKSCSSLGGNSLSSTVAIYWLLTDLFQITQSWYFWDWVDCVWQRDTGQTAHPNLPGSPTWRMEAVRTPLGCQWRQVQVQCKHTKASPTDRLHSSMDSFNMNWGPWHELKTSMDTLKSSGWNQSCLV